MTVEDEDLDKVQLESSHTIDITEFVPESEIDTVFLDGTHYLAPDDKVGEEAFAVIREAMKKKKVVGLGKLILNRRERIVALSPRGKGILMTNVHYKYEVREDDAYFDDIGDVKISEEMLDLAEHIIDKKKGKFDPERFEDRYENALIEMLRAKQQGVEITAPKQERPSNVVNLMDALRRSIESEKGAKAGKDEPARRPAEKSKAHTAKGAAAKTTKKSVAQKPARKRASG